MTHEPAVANRRNGGTAIGITLLLAVACICLIPAEAGAQSGPDELSEKAQSYYRQGQRHYKSGEYEKAAEKLRKAYALTPMPLLLYNICLAEWRAGNLEEATAMAMRAKREKLPASLRTKADARLAAFSSIRNAREVGARLGDRSAAGRAGTSNGGNTGGELARPGGPRRSDAAGQPRFAGVGWFGVGTVTLGAAGLTLAGVYDSRVADAVERMNQASRKGLDEKAERIQKNEVQVRQRNGQIFLFAGAGLAATGVTLIIWDLATAPGSDGGGATAGARIRPTVGFGRAAIHVRF